MVGGEFAGAGDSQETGPRRVTIADIAREAGVSVPTVSKVLNRRAEVADETRARVERLIAKHNYARRPGRQRERAGLVDLVFTELDGDRVGDIVAAVEGIAQEHGMGTEVTAVRNPRTAPRAWLERLTARRSDGVIAVLTEQNPQHLARLRTLGAPVVTVDALGHPDPRLPSVGATNWHGAVQATDHLIGLGHRRIAHATGPAGLQCSRARRDGYHSALAAAGLAIDPALTLPGGDGSVAAGERVAGRLLEMGVGDPATAGAPTAVFAAGDMTAIGVVRG
ncbi:hypothetical protein BIV57_15230, partial [Mangrovactinospora gilvigrisea]